MGNHMRNRLTTEYREVEPDGDDFRELQAQRGPDGRPVWEQTGAHDAAAHAARKAAETEVESDQGDEVALAARETEASGEVAQVSDAPPAAQEEVPAQVESTESESKRSSGNRRRKQS